MQTTSAPAAYVAATYAAGRLASVTCHLQAAPGACGTARGAIGSFEVWRINKSVLWRAVCPVLCQYYWASKGCAWRRLAVCRCVAVRCLLSYQVCSVLRGGGTKGRTCMDCSAGCVLCIVWASFCLLPWLCSGLSGLCGVRAHGAGHLAALQQHCACRC